MNSEGFYKESLLAGQATITSLKRKLRTLSLIRLLAFLAAATAIYFIWGRTELVLLVVLIFIASFLVLLTKYTQLQRGLKLEEAYTHLCKSEILFLSGDLNHLEGGGEFIDASHPYSSDLNIFGEHSMFRFINRTKTIPSRVKLASWLKEVLIDQASIESERNRISAMAKEPEFILRYLASASIAESDLNLMTRISEWLKSKALNRSVLVYSLLRFVLPLVTIGVTAVYALDLITFNNYVLYLFLPGLIVLSQIKKHQTEFNTTILIQNAASSTSEMLSLIREGKLKHQSWDELFNRYDLDESEEGLESLKKIVGAIESRNNVFVSILLNLFLMWDFQCAWRLKKWKEKYGGELGSWVELAQTVETYCSMGIYVFNHPQFVYPEITQDKSFHLKNATHFSIHSTAIPNSLNLEKEHRFSIITGANMAGKSTYLRTVGTSLVLAMRGLPVPAEEMKFTPVNLFTSMLATDSLGDSESYFFSELKRLRALMDRLEAGQLHFVILDEILKGTNSIDKAIGSRRFMEKILGLPAKGLIATHDLSLCDLANDYPEKVSNERFEISYAGEELVFNYKLESGVCENMNASFLLEKMGLIEPQ